MVELHGTINVNLYLFIYLFFVCLFVRLFCFVLFCLLFLFFFFVFSIAWTFFFQIGLPQYPNPINHIPEQSSAYDIKRNPQFSSFSRTRLIFFSFSSHFGRFKFCSLDSTFDAYTIVYATNEWTSQTELHATKMSDTRLYICVSK